MLAKISTTDITKFILAGSYDVNRVDEWLKWQDGNGKYHRDKVRGRVEGNFKMKFKTAEEYAGFVSLLNTNENSREKTISIQLFINNENATRTITAFYEFEPVVYKDIDGTRRFKEAKFKVEEQ